MQKGICNKVWGDIMKKKISIITTLSLITFASVAALAPRFSGANLEVNDLNAQVNSILNKTSDLDKFQMADVEL
jgi:hypothetical protein